MELSKDQHYQYNLGRLYKNLGDLLEPYGTKFCEDALYLTKPGYHENEFPTIPNNKNVLSELWMNKKQM